MDPIRRLIHEVHRRSLWQVLGIYCVGSWFAYEVILGLRDGIGLPDWVPAMTVALFLVGLPVVLATAFVQEGGPAPPVAPESAPSTAPGAGGAARPALALLGRHLTWRRAIGGGTLAFALLALATGTFLGMRSMGVGPVGTLVAKGVLEEREPILLADFENSTPDPSLGRVITDALRIDLLESPTVRVVDPADVREVLLRMGRAADAPVSGEVAREVALRGGWNATIEGDVSSVASGYLLTARVVGADGQVLAGFREQARRGDELLPAIDRLSKGIRAKVGESLRSVQRGMPLEAVSTRSLEALRLYSQAIRLDNADPLRAVQLYEEAVATDSTFAMAYRKLGAVLSNVAMDAHRQVEAVSRAYELRDRLTERERAHATAFYHLNLSGDYDASIATYRTLLERWPDDEIARNNLALAHLRARQPAEAEAVLEAMEGSLSTTHVNNLLVARFAQADTAGAWAVLEEFGDVPAGDVPARLPFGMLLLAAQGDLEEAEARVDSLRQVTRNFVGLTRADGFGASLALVRGRVERGRALLESAGERLARAGAAAERLDIDLALGISLVELVRDSAAARAVMEEALIRTPLDSLDVYARPYLRVAELHARLGEAERAAAVLTEYEARLRAEHRGTERPRLIALRGLVALAQGRAADAVRLLEEATSSGPCTVCYLPELGRAYAAAERLDDAIAAHERFLETPALFRYPEPGYQLPRVLEDLGVLYETRGDRAHAAAVYTRLLELWKDADPVLAARLEGVRARLARLAAEAA